MNPYAGSDQLAAYWRTLTAEEIARADILLALASNRLRQMAADLDIPLDDQVNASQVKADVAKWVVMEAVKRALATPTDAPPVSQLQQTAGPYSENFVFTNPAGDLWFKNSELRELGLYGRQKLDNVSSTPRWDIYAS